MMTLGDQLVLILLVMAATALFTAIGWDALFPDRRDSEWIGTGVFATLQLFDCAYPGAVCVLTA